MKAVVLVGGFGTRLRPLTETVKKELLPLVDRPILDHTLDRLVRHGIGEVVMSSPYLEEVFHPFIEARRGRPAITWVTETAPLGTGGAIVHALDALGDRPFFALNGDIFTDLDLTQMRAFHEGTGAEVTIALHHVEDARAFGLVQTDPRSRVLAFREKPDDRVPGDVNAGTYLVDPSALGSWRADREISVEREIFPSLIEAGHHLAGFVEPAYWIDLGTPENYLQAHADLLAGAVGGVSYPSPWIHPGADVAGGARLAGDVAVGDRAHIGAGADVTNTVLHAGSSIGEDASVASSILGSGARVGARARVRGCVLGESAVLADGLALDDARLSAGTTAP